MRYLVPLMPGQVRLQAIGRQIQLVVPNYFRVYPEEAGYVNRDSAVTVFAIEATTDQINVVQEGATVHHLLWKGNKNSRDNHADLVAVAVEALISPSSNSELVAVQDELAKAKSLITALSAQVTAGEDKVRVAGTTIVDLQAKLEANFAAAEKAIAEAKGQQSAGAGA